MSLSDADLQILEMELDGELSAEESSQLRKRMSTEPAMFAALEELREQRELRQQVFIALEDSSNATAAALVTSVRKQITYDRVWSGRMRIIRRVSAAAACIAFGLFAGWIGRGRMQKNSAQPNETSPVASITPVTGSGTGELIFQPGAGDIKLVGANTGRPGGYNVTITDDAGRTIGVQHFNTLNEARQFSDDLGKWQNKQRQMRSGNVKLIGDEF